MSACVYAYVSKDTLFVNGEGYPFHGRALITHPAGDQFLVERLEGGVTFAGPEDGTGTGKLTMFYMPKGFAARDSEAMIAVGPGNPYDTAVDCGDDPPSLRDKLQGALDEHLDEGLASLSDEQVERIAAVLKVGDK